VFSIIITEQGGTHQQIDFDAAEISIGRLDDNDVCLPKTNVSKRHARLIYKDQRYIIVDQQSTNGTFVNGRKITAPTPLRRGDKIYIGDFILTLAGLADSADAFDSNPTETDPHAASAVRTDRGDPTRNLRNNPGLPPELKRTNPGRRVLTPAQGTFGPQLNRPSPMPPPLPRSAPSPGSSAAPRTQPSAAAAQPLGPTGVPAEQSSPLATSKLAPLSIPSETPELTQLPSTAPGLPTTRLRTPKHSRGTEPSSVTESKSSGATSTQPSPLLPPESEVAHEREGQAQETRESQETHDTQTPLESSGLHDAGQAAALYGLTSPAVEPPSPSLRIQGMLSLLMERLAKHMNVARAEESAFPSEHQPILSQLLDQLVDEGALGPDVALLREAAISEAVGLGPLDRLLANREVREIVVDGPTRVLADLGGGLLPVAAFFSDDSAVLLAARRLLHRAGQKLVTEQLVHEAQLPGGGMLQLLLPPLSPKGPLLSVRCPVRAQPSPERLVSEGLLTSEMLNVLRGQLQQRKNILVFGPSGADVSQVLAMLTLLLPEHERTAAIEHAPSASLLNPQVLPLSRRASPMLSLRELLSRAALLRCERLLLDDLHPEDTWSALFAAAGSGGVLLGMHAPSATIALCLLEHGARVGVGDGNASVPAPLLAAAVQLLVHVEADAQGTRRIQSLSELRLTASDTLEVRTLFRHDGKAFVASFHGR